MKRTTLFFVLLVISALLISGCSQQQSTTPPAATQTSVITSAPTSAATAVPSAPAEQSTLVIAVKDAPKNMDFGTINHLWLNITEVSVHRISTNQTITDTDEEMTATESDDTSTAGWTVVISQTRTFDLIQLSKESLVIGEKMIDTGRYTQIRVKIDSGTITVNGTEYNLTVPGGVLKLNRGFVLEPGKTLKLTLDFNVEKSVIRTGSDQYKLKPVIAVISG